MRPLATLPLSSPFFITWFLASAALAQDGFALTSPVIDPGGSLPADLKCTRDGGDGLSPPLAWSDTPEGTRSIAVSMHHYPRGTLEGVDTPSHYWLLWNLPATTSTLERGNPGSIGDEGADKDMRGVGYTPPCSPPGPAHEYIITVYALDAKPTALPSVDDPTVDWQQMMLALDGHVLASSDLRFTN
ncbi:YbhB/YbcL family Raf kinase inhibitor-like protein [uncultured Tateyamaria sp.]|uniref:YbhB/YbcL family Raf kinase inhibitor-like protein n=1 Tax=uncultured Tateyamaria sp. TaxID=455651 RepID=UPI00262114F6|nr:YbhB/YbcL family Raf kinase inhibitor-like protein [uncultured Tateyamaria sp.]